MNPTFWLPLVAGGEFTQPRDHSLAQTCTLSLLKMINLATHLLSVLFRQIICRRGVSPSIQSFSASLKVLRNFDESDGGGRNSTELTMNLDAEMLDAYVKSFLPASLQEESFHRGAQMLRKELYFDMFPR